MVFYQLDVLNQRTELVEPSSHIIAVYQDKETKIDEAFRFLKSGLDKNEIVMPITDEISKDSIRKKMKKEWNVNVKELESSNNIIIRTAPEWYFPYGIPSAERIIPRWLALTEIARVKNKSGVRVFGDTGAFFRCGYAKELVDYESTLEQKFSMTFTAICAYDSKNMESLSPEQLETLYMHHGIVWK